MVNYNQLDHAYALATNRIAALMEELKAAQEELAACNQAGIQLYADNKAAQERIAELEKL